MTRASSRLSILPHAVDATLLASAGLLYLATLYPMIWWGDGPELVTAAWTGGVAHPSGYPVYLVLLKAFLLVGLGSIAWRANLFSAMASLAGLIFLLRLVPFDRENVWKPIGWRIGLAFLAFSPLLWEVSILPEVYSLSVAFFGAILWASKRWAGHPTRPGLLLLALLAGLATGHHRLLALMLPGLALGLAPVFSEGRARWTWLAGAVPTFLLALLGPYLLLYLRAKGSPPLNWEDPSTLSGLWNLFSASQFRTDQKIVHLQEWAYYAKNVGPHPWSISFSILASLPSIWWDNLSLGLLAAVAGFLHLLRERTRIFWSGLAAWLIPTVFLAQYHVADLEHFYLFPFLLVGLCCAIGCGYLLEWAASKHRLAAAGACVVLLGGVAVGVTGVSRPPEKVMEIPERYARRSLDALPPGALLLTMPPSEGAAGDYVYYPLLYMKEVGRRAQDAALVSTSFMTSPWYRTTLEREGITTEYFEDLVKGTEKVPVVDFDLESYLGGNTSKQLRFYRFEKRLIGDGYRSFLARVGESFFPSLGNRPLYANDDWEEIGPFIDREVEWTEILHVPILTRGVPSLDGKPIPTGKIYRADSKEK